MALATQPNITLTNEWREVASGVSQVTIQSLNRATVIVFIGAAAPAAGSSDGHSVNDEMTISGLTGEKVYARATSHSAADIAVTKG